MTRLIQLITQLRGQPSSPQACPAEEAFSRRLARLQGQTQAHDLKTTPFRNSLQPREA